MGNELSGIAPSQILGVESYLSDLPSEFERNSRDVNLGSTRFLKVAKVKHKEGHVVVKLLVKHDPSLRLAPYQDELQVLKESISGCCNLLPFQQFFETERAGYLIRQYGRKTLYDSMSTRPFLSHIEKKWIAFQLLVALEQCHTHKVCHGDIKSENVIVTGWSWAMLTDFASFKPVLLPEDNPADFDFFFDTSRRRSCYIAPERFYDPNTVIADPFMGDGKQETVSGSSRDNTGNFSEPVLKKPTTLATLSPPMDIFAMGCVLFELFTDGRRLFDLSQLLAYRAGKYNVESELEHVEDESARSLIRHMVQVDPSKRLSANQYLTVWKDVLFPTVMYSFLIKYCKLFANQPVLSSDEKIARLKRDFTKILDELSWSKPREQSHLLTLPTYDCLVVIISLITSCLRSLQFTLSKLDALELLQQVGERSSDECTLDRLVPFMVRMVHDENSYVKAAALRVLTCTLERVHTLPRSETNIFPEYILPSVLRYVESDEVVVRIAFAENLASLADTALRFLDLAQLYTDDESSLYSGSHLQYQGSYQLELENLHDLFEKKVVALLCDTENIVKRTLLEYGIGKLCLFFGRQKANDVLLSHLITFQNDKSDWQLRGAFFESVVGLVTYVGWHSLTMIMPLLQLGLTDAEEFVVTKAINALRALCGLCLFRTSTVIECLDEILPFLFHPNMWIRYASVGFVIAVSKFFCVADVYCVLLPKLQPYLKHSIIQPSSAVVVLDALKEPLSRQVFDYIVKQPQLQLLLERLKDRESQDVSLNADVTPDDPLDQVFHKLQSLGVTAEDEYKLLCMRELLCKIHNVKLGAIDVKQHSGIIKVAGLSVQCHTMELKPSGDMKLEILQVSQTKRNNTRRLSDPPAATDDWTEMFGKSKSSKAVNAKDLKQNVGGRELKTKSQSELSLKVSAQQMKQSREGKQQLQSDNSVTVRTSRNSERSGTPVRKQIVKGRSPTPPRNEVRNPQCKTDFQRYVDAKRDSYALDLRHFQQLSSSLAKCCPTEGGGWVPKGVLVAHYNEHKGYINRVSVMDDASFFGTCCDDGSVKLWNIQKIEKPGLTKQLRITYNKQGGKIKAMTFCGACSSFAAASDKGSVVLVSLNRMEETNSLKITDHLRLSLNVQETGNGVVEMAYFDTGKANVLACATVHGELIGYDVRAQNVAWRLQNNLKQGMITSFAVSPSQCWLTLGTSSGMHVCWDMRFQLPVLTWSHPGGHSIQRLVAHPQVNSHIFSSCHGSNEVDLWSMETGQRNQVFWASRNPPLSQQQDPSSRNLRINGMCCGWFDSGPYLLLGGTDRRLRLWDLTTPTDSHLVCNSGTDSYDVAVQYKHRVVDGLQVLIESDQKIHEEESTDDRERALLKPPPIGHMDSITDVAIAQGSYNYVITTSADGVVKVWK